MNRREIAAKILSHHSGPFAPKPVADGEYLFAVTYRGVGWYLVYDRGESVLTQSALDKIEAENAARGLDRSYIVFAETFGAGNHHTFPHNLTKAMKGLS